MTMPNFFIVGAMKGGTSTLHLWLGQHPNIYMPPRKELHFFCACPTRLRAVEDWDHYLAVFEGQEAKVIGEASPCYLYYPDAPALIHRRFPDAKILISLRDPVERFWSHYLMNSTYREGFPTPEEVLSHWEPSPPSIATDDLVGVGLYQQQVRRYIDLFGRENTLVIFLEETSLQPQLQLERVFSLLDIPPVAVDTSIRDKVYVEGKNRFARFLLQDRTARRLGVKILPAGFRRHLKYRVLGDSSMKRRVPPEIASQLQAIYRDDVRGLEEVLERLTPWSWPHDDTTPNEHFGGPADQ